MGDHFELRPVPQFKEVLVPDHEIDELSLTERVCSCRLGRLAAAGGIAGECLLTSCRRVPPLRCVLEPTGPFLLPLLWWLFAGLRGQPRPLLGGDPPPFLPWETSVSGQCAPCTPFSFFVVGVDSFVYSSLVFARPW